jgi:hypothetical protein
MKMLNMISWHVLIEEQRRIDRGRQGDHLMRHSLIRGKNLRDLRGDEFYLRQFDVKCSDFFVEQLRFVS